MAEAIVARCAAAATPACHAARRDGRRARDDAGGLLQRVRAAAPRLPIAVA
jgi:hypothetical protein